MTVSTGELLAAVVLIVGIGKAAWDFFLSERLLKRDEEQIEKDGKSGNEKLKEKIKALGKRRERDSRANQIAFAATTALSAWLISLGFSSADPDTKDVSDLQSRVSALEGQITALEARLPPE